MNLMELFVKIGVDDQASSKVQQISNTIGKGLSSAASLGTSAVSGTAKMIGNTLATAAKVGAAAIGAVSTAVVKLGKDAIESYADYEQLIGGVETLFKDSAELVEEYANRAYMTAGRSANEYMETVTSFSARLLQSLEGDTKAAAELADLAMQDMADNANKMGTDFTMIQNAYQAFAKNNWTLLDNLKLGYGGTAREMARLVNESGLLSEAQKINLDDTKNLGIALQEVGFDTIINAIHAVQVELGITGTTALEASKTISGSANAMKASWKNLLTAIASNNKDIKKNIKEFTESVGTFADNLLPRIDTVLDGLGMLVTELEPTLDGALGMAMDKLFTALPQMVNIGSNLVSTLVNGINSNKDKLGEAAKTTVSAISQFVFNEAPQLLKTGGDLILELVKGLEIKDMSEQAGKVIADMVLYLTDPNVVDTIIDAGFDLLEGLISGFTSGENVERLVGNITNLVTSLSDKITDNKEKIVSGAVSLLERFGKALDENNTISAIVNGVFSVVGGVISELIKPDNLKRIFNVAADLLDELADGIFGFTRNATTTIPDVIDALVETLTDKEATGALLDAGGRLAGAFLYGFHIWVSDGIASFMNLLADDFATLFGEDNALTQGLRDFADFNSNVRYNAEIAALYGMDEKLREEQQEVRENAPTLNQWQGVGKSENAEKLEMTQEMYDKLPDELKQNPNIVIIQNFNSEAKSAADMQDEAMYAAKNAILNGN